ncbi:MAG: putative glycolipid-binding domain-containing protein [Actinobacteria bacterium]|nr:putative glycolipid-binding domain-containing protein [Actinomycetota bacterium]
MAIVSRSGERLSARGSAIGSNPLEYRLEYRLWTGDRFVTERLSVAAEGGGWTRRLDLRRSRDGGWSCSASSEGAPDLPPAGGDVSPLQGADDCDLGRSPLTNVMPVLRFNMHRGGEPVEFRMAWVSVPDLAVSASRQRYSFVRGTDQGSIVRYESVDSGFTADLELDPDGFVVRYPGLAERLF